MSSRIPVHFLSLSTLSLLLWACAEVGPGTDELLGDETAVEAEEIELALESIADELGIPESGELGGLDDRDELPAFGNEAFAREFGREREGDPAADEAPIDDVGIDDVPSDGADRAYRIFHVMAVWGRIRPNDGVPVGLRWDPVISVRGIDHVRVLSTIRFERSDTVLPQGLPSQVDIVSATRPSVDGVILRVAINQLDAEILAPYLSFRSGPVSLQVDAEDLGSLDVHRVIDRAGNGLMLVGIERPIIDHCPNGFLAGRWVQLTEHSGVFGGAWRSADGSLEAHLAGRFGVNDAGEQVFHAKVIERDGRFRGFARGYWGDGHFRGEWHTRNGAVQGALYGRYGSPDAADEASSHFHFRGAWEVICDGPVDECRAADGTRTPCPDPTDPPECTTGAGEVVPCEPPPAECANDAGEVVPCEPPPSGCTDDAGEAVRCPDAPAECRDDAGNTVPCPVDSSDRADG